MMEEVTPCANRDATVLRQAGDYCIVSVRVVPKYVPRPLRRPDRCDVVALPPAVVQIVAARGVLMACR